MLAEAIDSTWFTPRKHLERQLTSNFQRTIPHLTRQALELLLQIHLRFHYSSSAPPDINDMTLNHLRAEGQASVGEDTVTVAELASTLCLMMLVEHWVDGILILPRNLREKDIDRMAELAGTSPQTLKEFVTEWHDKLRTKVYETSHEIAD